MDQELSNKTVANADNQQVILQKKVENFFLKSLPSLKSGLCPTRDILSDTVDKWSLFVVYNLGFHQKLRFNELKKQIRGISSRMLSVTLKKLEKHGTVRRSVFAEVPPRVEYELTDFGKELTEKLVDLNNWFLENSELLKNREEYL